ncbi:SDR family oxidoreductase [Spongisporangium articulatum]|uniref:SDR family oxidoreductase n=1 Tax=Spongisporangium articulatum TaxID=3362603 RepID=A0ABW8AIN0_9ACTN
MAGERVLVTGGSGFIGSHCIVQLLAQGYRVRTTVRSLGREPELRGLLASAGADTTDLDVARADLLVDDGWDEAAAGCDYVLHVASPFPLRAPKDENELIVPAREGALRVLRAAHAAGARRTVLTSSFAAIGYGAIPAGRPLDERDWSDPRGVISAYAKSKTLAEQAAWDFARTTKVELATVNPVAVFGPVLGPDLSTSVQLVRRLLDGSMPGLPQLTFGVVDVRDVADLHLRAMTDPAAAGERFLAAAGDWMSVKDMALTLKERLGPAGRRIPTRELPNWLVRAASLVDGSLRPLLSELGRPRSGTGAKARDLLGWRPRSNADALVATAESLREHGLVKG